MYKLFINSNIFFILHRKCLKGLTAIHYACRSASISSIVTLIEMGADPRTPETNENEIPLDLIPLNQQAKLGALLRNTCKRCYINLF